MNKNRLIVLYTMVLVVILVMINWSNNVDWSATFNENGTNPLDTKVFFDQLPVWFNGKSTKKIHTTFYEYDQYLRLQPIDSTKNYISISSNYNIDISSFNSLLEYVGYGNHAFISAHSFPYFMKDTLGFQTTYEPFQIKEPKRTLFLDYASDSLSYQAKIPLGAAYVRDTVSFKSLGYFMARDGEKKTNFIGIPYYDGIFYVHTAPEIFTNYQMLEATDTEYLNTVVSYLPNVPILLDKVVKMDADMEDSPLRFITSKTALKWSWYLLLLGLALFMIFHAKRRQRIVPITVPLKNTTTEFVHTVSNLHYEAEDYKGIIQKMIIHFLEHVRSNYHLPTENLNGQFAEKLAMKSGRPLKQTQELVKLISKMKSYNFKTKAPLIKLNKELEKFYNHK